jgi:hypothetical protein
MGSMLRGFCDDVFIEHRNHSFFMVCAILDVLYTQVIASPRFPFRTMNTVSGVFETRKAHFFEHLPLHHLNYQVTNCSPFFIQVRWEEIRLLVIESTLFVVVVNKLAWKLLLKRVRSLARPGSKVVRQHP